MSSMTTNTGMKKWAILYAKTICFLEDNGVPESLPLDIFQGEVCKEDHTRLTWISKYARFYNAKYFKEA